MCGCVWVSGCEWGERVGVHVWVRVSGFAWGERAGASVCECVWGERG